MKQTFIQFIIANFTLTVFVSLIVYRFFEIILDKFLTPVFNTVVDPGNNFGDKKITIGNYDIEYGKSLRYTAVLFLVLIAIYYLFRTK
tara:strand:+ start:175 stop:438 length:264 start_codon:yes stop_codon:yes gene_type:complete